MTGGLRSGQVADAAGVNLQTVRYYERRGLLARPERTPGGHRVYPAETVATLRAIKAAQRLGFSLDEIAGLLPHTPRRPRGPAGAGRPGLNARATAKLAEIDARIADLRAVAATLRTAIAAGCDDLEACAADPACPIPVTDTASTRRAEGGRRA